MKIFCFKICLTMLLFSINCESEKLENDNYNENIILKTKLIGDWSKSTSNPLGGKFTAIEFTNSFLLWRDSIVNLDDTNSSMGEIQVVYGSCPIKYTFNDGIKHFNHCDCNFYNAFEDINDTDLIWIASWIGKSIIYDYQIKNGKISLLDVWEASDPPVLPPFTSNAVRFITSDSAEFYQPWTGYSYFFSRLK